MRISAATDADIPALSELLSLLFEQEAEFQADPAAQRRGLENIIANPALGSILVAAAEGRVVGMLNLLFSISTALGGPAAWLEDMIVHPGWRHQGVGSALLNHAVEVCRSKGCRRITLLTDGDNLNAQAFYRKHGFTVSAMLPMRRLLADGDSG